tara:strand:+ start:460 stop:897 length:438 start_codon:yes stop_codon:yes gene_type:complete
MENLKKIVKSNLVDDIQLMDLVHDTRSDYIKIIVDSPYDIPIDKTSYIARSIKNDENIISMFPNGCRLEVGTPGIGSNLNHSFQYKKNIGRKISLTYLGSDNESVSKIYKLIDSDESGVKVKNKNVETFIHYEKIVTAKIKVSFD